jgi:hypothetical protein
MLAPYPPPFWRRSGEQMVVVERKKAGAYRAQTSGLLLLE